MFSLQHKSASAAASPDASPVELNPGGDFELVLDLLDLDPTGTTSVNPDLDMVRFHQFRRTNNMPALHEYGNAAVRDEFEVLKTLSPYQNVRDGVAYPAVMLTQGDLDTRVPPLQARKMAARLQLAFLLGQVGQGE